MGGNVDFIEGPLILQLTWSEVTLIDLGVQAFLKVEYPNPNQNLKSTSENLWPRYEVFRQFERELDNSGSSFVGLYQLPFLYFKRKHEGDGGGLRRCDDSSACSAKYRLYQAIAVFLSFSSVHGAPLLLKVTRV